ncbi:DUF6089 family protein [Hydrotalea sp.]|uniref:DUF6089 family protein n=2 Tax=Hydrotalea sp. TaxID=2881279 RepID=UPI0026303E0F|nr:DUF6089 family protein [Hydrotalea sp.]
MHLKASFRILLLIVIVALNSPTMAQRVRAFGGIGVSAYLGDLIQGSPAFKQVSPDVMGGATYDLGEKIRYRLGLSLLGVKGNDALSPRADLRDRNLNFKSFVWEVSNMMEYDILDRNIYNIVPYVFGGFGLFHFNPTTYDRNGNKVYLHDVGTEGQYLNQPGYPKPYHRMQLNIPFGAGVRYEVSNAFAVGFEFNYRILFTDYLDDVSTPKYATDALIAAGQLEAASLSFRGDEVSPGVKPPLYRPRGNPHYKDSYYSFQVTFSVRLDNVFLGGKNYISPAGGYFIPQTRSY